MSKELQAFRDILGILSAVSGCEVDMESERVKIVEKSLKALEIIKEKPFILQNIFENKGLKNQQEYDKKYFWGTITQEEFDLLKEVLGE